MSTAFPGALDDATTLYDVVNNATSTLSGSYTTPATTLELVSAALFPSFAGTVKNYQRVGARLIGAPVRARILTAAARGRVTNDYVQGRI